MIDLIDFIVKQLVTKPEEVKVTEGQDEGGMVLSLAVAPEDMGIVIGKSGQTIKALRKILAVRAMNEGVRVYLHLEDQNGHPSEGSESTEQVPSAESEETAETTRNDEPVTSSESDETPEEAPKE